MSDALHHHQDAIADSYGPQLERLELEQPYGVRNYADTYLARVRAQTIDVDLLEQLVVRRSRLWPMLRPEECTLEAMEREIDAVHRGPAPWLPRGPRGNVVTDVALLLESLADDPIDYARIHRGRKSIPTQPPMTETPAWWTVLTGPAEPTVEELVEARDRAEWIDACRVRLQEALARDLVVRARIRARYEAALALLHFVWQHEGDRLLPHVVAELAAW